MSSTCAGLKLKNLGRFNKPRIRLYNLEDAEKIHQEWRKAVTNAEMEEGTSKIQQMAPPPMGEQEIPIKKVAHVSSPSMFWVYYGEGLEPWRGSGGSWGWCWRSVSQCEVV